MVRESVESVRLERKRSMEPRGKDLLKSQVLSSEWNTERVREDASGDSEDGEIATVLCLNVCRRCCIKQFVSHILMSQGNLFFVGEGNTGHGTYWLRYPQSWWYAGAEIARFGGYYSVQAHSRLLIESPVDFLLVKNANIKSCTVFKLSRAIGQIFTFDNWCHTLSTR